VWPVGGGEKDSHGVNAALGDVVRHANSDGAGNRTTTGLVEWTKVSHFRTGLSVSQCSETFDLQFVKLPS